MEIGLIRFNEADFVQCIEEERQAANTKIWGNRTFCKRDVCVHALCCLPLRLINAMQIECNNAHHKEYLDLKINCIKTPFPFSVNERNKTHHAHEAQ